MTDANDMDLVREFARHHSEAAFTELVRRHVNLVYSVARRCTMTDSDAQDVTQAVFMILSRKAAGLRARTVLTGWLYETTRFTAACAQRTNARRHAREQEAYMQSTLNEPDLWRRNEMEADAWTRLAPHLEAGMAQLGERDRTLLALRFYENKSGPEAAALLGIQEAAAHKRTARALEKLRKFFFQRGVALTATALTAAISVNSVQAAPAGLAATVTAVAAKGAAVSGSTLTLIKGALKVMAWTKMKTAIVIGVSALLAAGTATVVVEKGITRMNSILTQRLDDGSTLVLNRVSFGDKHKFSSSGRTNSWNDPGHDRLVVEFRLIAKDGANQPLVKPAFYRQFRCMVRGEKGIEFAEEFSRNQFKQDAGDYYGYITTSIFPRDSKWLWFRIEKSETNNPYGPWQTVAEFKTANPTRSAKHTWVASPTPITNAVDGMNFVLGEVTVEMRPLTSRDIWNHVVTVPTQVFMGGVLLTNWSAMHFQIQDASGNWNPILQTHRSLDPRFVWKLEMDFEPDSDFPDGSKVTVSLPKRASAFTTNVMNVPVTISWDGNNWIDASMPTNRPDLGLRYISATDDQGESLFQPSGSGGQYAFREGSFMAGRGGFIHIGDVTPATVTFAVVPNVHTTFYAQPKLVDDKVK